MNKTILCFIALYWISYYSYDTHAQTTTITDIDGNTYHTIVIGDQEWMGENLRVTKYRNGQPIATNPDHRVWQTADFGLWEHYDKDPSNTEKYGKLYNWYATVDSRGLCPTGWRTPTDEDWEELVNYVDPNARGNNNTMGMNLKSCRQVNHPNGGACYTDIHPRWDSHGVRYGTDNYGFGALPAGRSSAGVAFVHKGQIAYFWSSSSATETNAWSRNLAFNFRGISRTAYYKTLGISVRCIRGEEYPPPAATHTLTFDIQDTEGNSITDAIITFEGTEYTDYIFEDLANGTYNYSISKEGFQTQEGSVEIADADKTHTLVLQAQSAEPQNEVTIGDINATAGDIITIEVWVDNTDAFVAFQMDFHLPEGLAFETGSLEYNTERISNHQFNSSVNADNRLRVLGSSSNNSPYIDNNGLLYTFRLSTPTQAGEWTITPEGTILTSPDYSNILTGVNGGVVVLVDGGDDDTTTFNCGEEVTFTYNGEEVTYGTVAGANGRCWLDRNLGASRVAQSSTDAQAYGDLFQWGRPADGHQLIDRTTGVPVSGTTSTLSSVENPEHLLFITNGVIPYEWLRPQNDDLWQGVDGLNNPCPAGFRLPTKAEWLAEHEDWSSLDDIGAFSSPLLLPVGGFRAHSSGTVLNLGEHGRYWSSTIEEERSYDLHFNSSNSIVISNGRANGFSVRCIQHTETPTLKLNLNIQINPENSGTANGSGEYEAGTEVSLTASANEGYEFVNWTLGDDVLSTDASFVYIMPESEVMVVANFVEVETPTIHSNKYFYRDTTLPNSGGNGFFALDPNYSINEITNTFTYDFWVKPTRTVNMVGESNACSGDVSVPLAFPR